METTVRINENYVNVIVNALKSALTELNAANAKATFANLKDYKKELQPSEALAFQKAVNSKFSKLELAQLKQLTKTESKNIGSSERAKQNINILSTPVNEQKKKIKNALSSYLVKQVTDKFDLHFLKADVLAEYDKITDEDFQKLYNGGLIQVDNVYRYVVNRCYKAQKAVK